MLWRIATRILLSTLLLCSSAMVAAEIYKYRDAKGRIHFTDRPMSGDYRLVWRSGTQAKRQSVDTMAQFRQNREKYSPLIDRTAERTKLSPKLLHAIVRAESAYNPLARSEKGAQGLMQLMPGTAKRFGVNNAYDPAQNLEGGAQYLKVLLKQFKYDLKLALAAYNAGENAVIKHGNQIPPYPETKRYVAKVLNFYHQSTM